jgi:hypothetical protein
MAFREKYLDIMATHNNDRAVQVTLFNYLSFIAEKRSEFSRTWRLSSAMDNAAVEDQDKIRPEV